VIDVGWLAVEHGVEDPVVVVHFRERHCVVVAIDNRGVADGEQSDLDRSVARHWNGCDVRVTAWQCKRQHSTQSKE